MILRSGRSEMGAGRRVSWQLHSTDASCSELQNTRRQCCAIYLPWGNGPKVSQPAGRKLFFQAVIRSASGYSNKTWDEIM